MKNSNKDYAVIDLGSNSFHFFIARNVDNQWQIIYRNKEHVHLASGLDKDLNLDDDAINRGVECLKLFSDRLKTIDSNNIRVVATHTLRVAKNRNQFLLAASKIFPYPIEIIPGQEESRLIYLGVISSQMTRSNQNKLVIDIGGGSTEISLGVTEAPLIAESFPMGSVTFAKHYFPDGIITKKAFDAAQLAAFQLIECFKNQILENGVSIAFGTSGTAKAIQDILSDFGIKDNLITQKSLNEIITHLLSLSNADEINYPSLSETRRPILLSGIAIFSALFSAFELTELHYAQSALREGVLFELAGEENHVNVWQVTVEQLINQYDIDIKYAKLVGQTAKHFYKQLQMQLNQKWNKDLKNLLVWATQLHEIGLGINFSNLHKHSAYILKNSRLNGFSEEQRLFLSTLVRFHRKSIKFEQFPEFHIYSLKQFELLLQMLRLSILINVQRLNNQNCQFINLMIDADHIHHITLEIKEEFAQNHPLIMSDLMDEQKVWGKTAQWKLIINTI